MIKTRKSTIALVSVLAICMIVSVTAQPTSFLTSGHVFNVDSGECDNPSVNVTNTNTSEEWQAETNASSNFYQLLLDNSTNVNE